MFAHNFCSYYIKTNLTLYSYVLVHRNTRMYNINLRVDMHLILAVCFVSGTVQHIQEQLEPQGHHNIVLSKLIV